MFTGITDIFNINCEADLEKMALKVFQFQYQNNTVYRQWCEALNIDPVKITSIKDIPFLPIEFFKTHQVVTTESDRLDEIFTSSSTTSQIPSKHYVKDVSIYERSFNTCFELQFGSPKDYCILALLPGYLDRKGSSLVYMCKEMIEQSEHAQSGFYLRNLQELVEVIEGLKLKKQKTLLIGVSYALLDLAEMHVNLTDDFIVMETGGMKGTRREMLKEELHAVLKQKFNVKQIASEYGMTELLSQAYAKANGEFVLPPWMKVMVRDINDPLSYLPFNKTGGINVIDLANVYSCSFIATKDLAQILENGILKLMGRYDNSDVRGCNLMVS